MRFHGAVASGYLGEEIVRGVLADHPTALVRAPYRAMLAYLEKLTLAPASVDETDIAALRMQGLPDGAIMEAAGVCFLFSVINRLADAFGFALPTESMQQTAVVLVKTIGYRPAVERKPSSDADHSAGSEKKKGITT